ncbi:tail fiber domain-containing protein [bacterium]|nr:tail fiber domain-containing protein [bacterium]
MALELRRKSKQYLKSQRVAIEDNSPLSEEFFGLSDFPKYFGEGKNSFRIRPRFGVLKPNTKIDIEVLDSNGNPVYWEIPTYKDNDKSRLISVWVYDVADKRYNTPDGPCEVIILGTLPDNQKVRWSRRVDVVKNKKSVSEIVFREVPNGSVSSSIEVFSNIPQSNGDLTKTSVSGQFTYKKSLYGDDVSFEATTPIINGEMISGSLELDLSSTTLFPRLGGGQSQPTNVTASITEVISNQIFRVSLPITSSDKRSEGSIHTYEYSDGNVSGEIKYLSSGSLVTTQNQVAIANITLTNVNPESGRVSSVNTLIKSQGLPNADFEIMANTSVPNNRDITYKVAIPTEQLNDPKTLKVQFLNNSGDVSSTEVIIENVIFEGGNVYIGGTQSIITGSIFVSNAIGSGLEIGGHSSGFMKSVGYEGVTSASDGTGPGGFIIYSGSGGLQMGADVLQGVGMQFVGDNDDRHLIFTTHDGGLLDVKTDKFFIGTENTQFISGSDGNIEISSSLFHLDPANNLLFIGADAVIDADLSVNNIRTPALIGGSPSTDTNSSSSIKSDGFARFVSASIGGWGVDTGSIFSDNLEINSTGKIKTRDYIPDNKGWIIDETGIAEFANVKIRGTLATTTFEKESVNAVGGQLYVANSTTLSGSYSSSLDSIPSIGVTSSTSLPSQFGDNSNDNLEFNSTEFSVVSIDDSDKFTIDSSIYADNESATLNYSQSNAFSSQISASEEVTVSTTIPYSASFLNRTSVSNGQSTFDYINFAVNTPGSGQESDFLNIQCTITEMNGVVVFSNSSDTATAMLTSLGPPTQMTLLSGVSFNGTYGVQTLEFALSFTDTTSVTEEQASQYVYKKAGTWPTSIADTGKIIFNDGGGSHTFDILERINARTLRIDTSSHKPNTSGSNVVATGNYSSSLSDSITISAGTGSLTEFIYDNISSTSSQFIVDNVSGFAVNEILTLKKVNDTGFTTEYVLVTSSSRLVGGSDTDLSGILNVTRAYGSGTTGNSASLGDIASIAQDYESGQVVVSTGKVGSGFIRLNANPNDTSTPYMDIVERTGSGLYDVELKARLGDLSGLDGTDMVLGRSNPGFGLATDNVFLQGGIIATYGEIGGFSIDTNTISSSNNNLILRDNGQITGSTVLLDGGTIGGFELTSTQINSTNDLLILKSNGHITASAALISGSGIQVDTPNFSIDADGDVEANAMVLRDASLADAFSFRFITINSSNVSSYMGTYSGSDGNVYCILDLSGQSSVIDNTTQGASYVRFNVDPTYPIGSIIHPYLHNSDTNTTDRSIASTLTIESGISNVKFAIDAVGKSSGTGAKRIYSYDGTTELVDQSANSVSTIQYSYIDETNGSVFYYKSIESLTKSGYTYSKVIQTNSGQQFTLGRNFFAWKILGASEYDTFSVGDGNFQIDSNGEVTSSTHVPQSTNAYDLGSTSHRWRTVYSINSLNTSDRNEKKNISGSDLGLNFVNSLNPVKYNWVWDNDDSPIHYGLIAQEVDGIVSNENVALVHNENDNWSIAYNELISPMIKAIQELSDEVNQLKLQLSQSQG